MQPGTESRDFCIEKPVECFPVRLFDLAKPYLRGLRNQTVQAVLINQ